VVQGHIKVTKGCFITTLCGQKSGIFGITKNINVTLRMTLEFLVSVLNSSRAYYRVGNALLLQLVLDSRVATVYLNISVA